MIFCHICSSLSHISLCVFKPHYCTCLIYANNNAVLQRLCLYFSQSTHSVQLQLLCVLFTIRHMSPFALKPVDLNMYHVSELSTLCCYEAVVASLCCISLYLPGVILCCFPVKVKHTFFLLSIFEIGHEAGSGMLSTH